jgi:hypothetical protein
MRPKNVKRRFKGKPVADIEKPDIIKVNEA